MGKTEKDYRKEHMAKVVGRSLSISTKYAIEISNHIRGRKLSWAKQELEDIINMKVALPLTRFNGDRGHKPGMGPGAYPIKAAKQVLLLLTSAEANAQFLGLNTSNLIIKKIAANKAAGQWHYGRQRRRQMKRTNMEIILEEGKKEDGKGTKTEHKDKKKTENKKDEKAKEIKATEKPEINVNKDKKEGQEKKVEPPKEKKYPKGENKK